MNNASDVHPETPIMSSAITPTKVMNETRRCRIAFRINKELDITHYFNYDDTLLTVMQYVQRETELTDFVFISQYPPLHIDSAYLDGKMAQQMKLFSSNDDEKSNESQYDDVQQKLNKTLYELSLVPSCRVFIQPKFKGHARTGHDGDNVLMQLLYFLVDILKIGFEYGYNGILYA